MTEDHQAGEQRRDDGSEHRYLVQPRTIVGRMLREDREARGLKQVEAASELGMAQGKLSAYERGAVRYPPPVRLVALARLYGRPDNYYLEQLGWSNGAKLVQQMPPAGALVVTDPAAGLAELVALAQQLDPADLAELIDTASFLVTGQRDTDEPE